MRSALNPHERCLQLWETDLKKINHILCLNIKFKDVDLWNILFQDELKGFIEVGWVLGKHNVFFVKIFILAVNKKWLILIRNFFLNLINSTSPKNIFLSLNTSGTVYVEAVSLWRITFFFLISRIPHCAHLRLIGYCLIRRFITRWYILAFLLSCRRKISCVAELILRAFRLIPGVCTKKAPSSTTSR